MSAVAWIVGAISIALLIAGCVVLIGDGSKIEAKIDRLEVKGEVRNEKDDAAKRSRQTERDGMGGSGRSGGSDRDPADAGKK